MQMGNPKDYEKKIKAKPNALLFGHAEECTLSLPIAIGTGEALLVSK